MSQTRPKVLYDMRLASREMGFSGIPQDSRLLLSTLAKSSHIEVSGLLAPQIHRFPYGSLREIGVQASSLANDFNFDVYDKSIIERLLSKYPSLGRIYRLAVRAFFEKNQIELVNKAFADVVWREFLSMTLPSSDKLVLDAIEYRISNLGGDRAALSSIFNVPKPKLDTSEFDFYLSQDSISIKLAKHTRHVVRYHDGLPVLASDTAPNGSARLHMGSLKHANIDAIYVCNTPSALNDLCILSPRLAENALVIPYSLPKMTPFSGDIQEQKKKLFIGRKSSFSKKIHAENKTVLNFSRPYILSLATIEPRKNYELLIDAWSRLQNEIGDEFDLVIAGKPGWKYDRTLNLMSPHIAQGKLHHLENVAQAELPALYSGASLFVFPSFAEGFGLPPIEAMGCGTPTLMSDIPAHRFSGGSAALFFNPYDVEDLVHLMREVLSKQKLKNEMVKSGFENVQRFTDEVNMPQWEQLFAAKRKK